MSATLTWLSRFRIELGFTSGFLNTSLDTLRGDGMDTEETYTSATTPDVDDGAMLTVTLVAGAASLNLASLADELSGNTKNATGKKIRGIIFSTIGCAAAVTIAKGASNGHTGLGANFSIALPPDSILPLLFGSDVASVASGDRTLDFAGTGTDAIEVGVVWGGT